ncbi:MAG: redoxin domain-containing protein [Pirellulaceae bacterium]
MRVILKCAMMLAVTTVGCATLLQRSSAAELLTIGSAAPALDVEYWIHKDQGKFPPVTNFEAGQVYVVEFWATWCGPCVASMPHLAELQTKLADKGVRLISISDEDLETVEEFLDREVRQAPGAKPDAKVETYRQLTSAYSLTTDPDRSSSRDYMEAAGQNGIPTAFIVGKDAKIEWIGHPMEMDGPLEAVLEGKWDREAFAAEIKAQQEAEKTMQEIAALLRKQDFEGAIQKIDAALAATPDDLSLEMFKLEVLVASDKGDAAAEQLQKIFLSVGETPEVVNAIAWNVYEMASQGRIEKGPLIDHSLAAATKALEKTAGEEKASMLDTLAHLQIINDNLDKAIELETAAAAASGDRDREFIEAFLLELKELKADQTGEKPEK